MSACDGYRSRVPCWVIAVLPDPKWAAFYTELFGWVTDTFDTGEGEVTMWPLPGCVGGEPEQLISREVVVMAPMTGDRSPDVPPQWSIDFWVYDVGATADKAAKPGGRKVTPPFETSVGRTARMADPPGRRVLREQDGSRAVAGVVES